MARLAFVLVFAVLVGFLCGCSSPPPKATSTDLDLRKRHTGKYSWGTTNRKKREFHD